MTFAIPPACTLKFNATDRGAPRVTLSIYPNFDGNCLEAFEFYRYVFGSDFDLISTFGEGPPDIGMSDDERDRYAGPDGSQIRREDT